MGLYSSFKDKVHARARVLMNTAVTAGKRNPTEEGQEEGNTFVDPKGVENFRREKLINSIKCSSKMK